MGLFDRLVNQVASQAVDAAAKQINKQIKDSGVIESTIDDVANKMTNSTKFAKVMKCPYCTSEYDNTLVNCPNCGAANENRKYDYQANK